MSINKVNTTVEEQNFKFLTNQSNILYTSKTKKITINGVNVIVDTPKVGDVMCVTRYTDENDSLLPADQQEVVWIDGLSINPKQLSQEYEPVGICVAINGNKAMVRYREERYNIKWSAGERWELPNLSIMNDGAEHTLQIKLNNKVNPNPFTFTAESRLEFVNKLNTWFLANNTDYSAELVELDTDLPATDTSDDKDVDSYRNRVIVNARFDESSGWNTFSMIDVNTNKQITTTRAIGKHIKAVNWYYINNGFTRNYNGGGCCNTKYYDFYSFYGENPSSAMTSINTSTYPVNLSAFTSNVNCQILRDNFATYDEYVDSMMVKYPCGAGGTITEFPSGKENTYKLADCTFLDNANGKQEPLYLAANWAASININAPGLQAGNWWLPSSAEMAQMMRDITYDTSFWVAKPDIVNRVISKFNSISNSGWSMLSASTYRWTSSRYDQYGTYGYDGNPGYLGSNYFYYTITVAPITLYEF